MLDSCFSGLEAEALQKRRLSVGNINRKYRAASENKCSCSITGKKTLIMTAKHGLFVLSFKGMRRADKNERYD
jgi:hypothetical protein